MERKYIDKLNFGANEKVLHLSHNDLDGFGSSYIFRNFYISYYPDRALTQVNCNYGQIIDTLSKAGADEATKIIITDLNLTMREADYLNDLAADWVVYDHHSTGSKTQKEYHDNYCLDTKKCGTLLTFEAVCASINNMKFDKPEAFYEEFKDFVNMVNSYDLWLQENNMMTFNQGSCIAAIIKKIPFKSNQLVIDFTDWLFGLVQEELLQEGIVLETFEIEYMSNFSRWINNKYRIDNEVVVGKEYISDRTIPINTKLAYLHSEFLGEFQIGEGTTSDGIDFILYTDISSIYQHAFDDLFRRIPDLRNTVLIHFTPKYGSVAARSCNGLANQLTVRIENDRGTMGGGHPNAGGASYGRKFHGKDEYETTENFIEMLEASKYVRITE